MKIRYDKETDSVFFVLSEDAVVESEELKKNIIVDYNSKDEVVSIEILNFKQNEHSIDLPLVLKTA